MLEEQHRGVVVCPTATGKTTVLTKMVWDLSVKTLVITPSKAITDMMVETLIKHFGKGKVEKLTTKKVKLKEINVVNIQALVRMKPELFEDVRAVFCDEFHHCLLKGTKIKTDKGVISIGQIVDDNIDCKVLSYNFKDNKWEFRKVLNRFKYAAPADLIEIEYESFGKIKTLTCTLNHKIYTSNRGYVEAQFLTLEDDVVIDKPYYTNVELSKLDNETLKTQVLEFING
jgi:hypothetical protein